MIKEKEKLANIHFNHSTCFNELTYYAKELKLYEQRLNTLINSNPAKMLEEMVAFQELFGEQKMKLLGMMEQIKKHETLIKDMAQQNGSIKHLLDHGHNDMWEKLKRFREEYTHIKNNFFLFMERWI